MSRHLPPRPNLEYLKNLAKERLPDLRQRQPAAQLADAQHAIAVDYGFINWSSLKAHIEGLAHISPLAGAWRADLSLSRPPDRPFRRAALHVDVSPERVTITDTVVDASGREARGVNTIHADGQSHPSAHGYALTARWRDSHALETVVTKDQLEVSRLTYEVSRDGGTLTLRGMAAAHEGYPAVDELTVFTRDR